MIELAFLTLVLSIAAVVWGVFYWDCRRRRLYLEQIGGRSRIWARDTMALGNSSISDELISEACQEAAALAARAVGNSAEGGQISVRVTRRGPIHLIEGEGLGRIRLVVCEGQIAPVVDMQVAGVPRAYLALIPILLSALVRPWPNALFLCLLPLPYVFDFGYSLSYLRFCLTKRVSSGERSCPEMGLARE